VDEVRYMVQLIEPINLWDTTSLIATNRLFSLGILSLLASLTESLLDMCLLVNIVIFSIEHSDQFPKVMHHRTERTPLLTLGFCSTSNRAH
jgi:hypothetical protein